MYICVNSDLKMRPGHMAAQVAHITQLIVEEIIRDMYETFPVPAHCETYMKWCKNPTVVVLSATESQLHNLMKHEHARSFNDNINGKQELTSLGFFPGCSMKSELRNYKLI